MSFSKWRIAQASVAGQSHLNQDFECQDRLLSRKIESNEGEVLIAVVADGAGSTREGGRGAEIACEIFVEQIERFLNSRNAAVGSLNAEFGKFWVSHFQEKILEVAKESAIDIREFASTLVGAVIGSKSAVFYQIGDGGSVFSTSGARESYRFGIQPEDAEYVNLTDFITDQTAGERVRFSKIEERIEDLILFSDGIFPVAVDFRANKPHEPFLMPMIAPLRNLNSLNGLNGKLESFLSSAKLNEKSDDDKSILLASRAVNLS